MGVSAFNKSLFNSAAFIPVVQANFAADPGDYTTFVTQSKMPSNLLTYSEEFDNAAWAKVNSGVTPNGFIAPDGTTSMDLVYNNTGTTNIIRVRQIPSVLSNTAYTTSFYIKDNNAGFAFIGTYDNGSATTLYGYINLSTGATQFDAGLSGSVTQLNNNTWRLAVTRTSSATATSFQLIVGPATAFGNLNVGDGVGVYVWGAQLEVGSTASSYVKTTAAGVPALGTVSRAGLATMYDSTGKLTYAPNNLAVYSQTPSDATWSVNGTTKTSTNNADPFGTSTALLLTASGGVSSHSITQSSTSFITYAASVKYMMSCYIKAGTATLAQLTFNGATFGASQYANFSLSGSGTVTASTGGTASITPLTGGWYRISWAAVCTGSATSAGGALFFISSGTDARAPSFASTDTLYIAGWQVEAVTYQTTPSTYVATTTAAYYGPRFDYDPSTLAAKGLLIEGSRTNLQTYSNTPAQWTFANGNLTANNQTSPDGTTNASTFDATATDAYLRPPTVTGVTNGVQYTASVFLKGNNGLTLRFYEINSLTYVTVTCNGSFQRVVLPFICGVANAAILQVGGASSFNSGSVVLYGFQLEQANFATSYIPTVASSVTRAAETFTVSGYANRLLEAYYIDQQTNVVSSTPETVVSSGDVTINPPAFGWVTSIRAYNNAHAGNIAIPSWIDNSGTTGNRMVTDSTGTLTYAPANMVAFSQDLSVSQWTKTNVTVASTSEIAPDGSATASRIQFAAIFGNVTGSGTGAVFYPVGRYVVSFWVKVASGTRTFSVRDNSGPEIFAPTATPTWPRVSGVWDNAIAPNALILIQDRNASGFVDTYIWGVQVEPVTYQTTPRPYIPTTTAAYYGPRFDYDASTVPATPRGLLIEESRVNLVVGLSNWTRSNVSFTGTTTTAPDGTSVAPLTVTTTAATTMSRATSGAGSAGGNSYSIYVKKGSGATDLNKFILRNTTTTTVLLNITFNYDTGAITYVTGSSGASAQNVGNGWWRLTLTATTGISAGNTITCFAGAIGNSETAGMYVYVWGAQLEAGSFATSYIPTTTASVTRAADVVKLTGSALTTLQGSVGSVLVETNGINGASEFSRLVGTDGSGEQSYLTYGSSTAVSSWNGSANITATIGGSGTWSGTVRSGVSFSSAGRSIVANNGTVVTSATAFIGFNNSWLGGSNISTRYASGLYRSLALYNRRLPNEVLKAKSTVGASY